VEEKEESDDVRSLCLPLIPFCFATFLFPVMKKIPLLSSTLFLYYRNEGCTTFIALMPSQPNAIVYTVYSNSSVLFWFLCMMTKIQYITAMNVHFAGHGLQPLRLSCAVIRVVFWVET
jgi:hypothetical protein